jgi:hypothetical protein
MAHVIEPPKPEDFEKIKCDDCRSLIGYVPSEVKSYSGRDMSGGPDGREWVVCPHCGEDITVRSW